MHSQPKTLQLKNGLGFGYYGFSCHPKEIKDSPYTLSVVFELITVRTL